jgi:hypothetical protein
MSRFARIGVVTILVAALSSLAASAAATPKLPDLPVSDLFTGPGHMTKLRSGVTYQAGTFPLALRITPPDGSWAGAQWKANQFSPEQIKRRHLRCPAACKPPYYGWAAVGQGGTTPTAAPRGLILIMTAYARTPSVAATVAGLRTRGHGATYEATSPVNVAGFSGVQFDGEVVGTKHVFVPFSPRTHKAEGFADAIEVVGPGRAFRFVVLNVRGKTVIVFIGSYVLSGDRFAAFLPEADELLRSLRFPG